jgi:hypothetical protein
LIKELQVGLKGKKDEGREGMGHVLSRLEVGCVTLLNDWFPSIKPYSLGTNVALNPLLNGFVEMPLMLWVYSCIMMLVTLDDLSRNTALDSP